MQFWKCNINFFDVIFIYWCYNNLFKLLTAKTLKTSRRHSSSGKGVLPGSFGERVFSEEEISLLFLSYVSSPSRKRLDFAKSGTSFMMTFSKLLWFSVVLPQIGALKFSAWAYAFAAVTIWINSSHISTHSHSTSPLEERQGTLSLHESLSPVLTTHSLAGLQCFADLKLLSSTQHALTHGVTAPGSSRCWSN